MSSTKEKPSRLSLGQLSRLQESTRRNVDDVFADIVDPDSASKPAPPAAVPAFRAIAAELPKEPAPMPIASIPAPSTELPAVATPANDPGGATPVAPTGGEGERRAAPAPKATKHRRHSLKGEPCAAHPGESKRDNLVSVRFTPEEMEDLEHWAVAEGLPLSVMVRDMVIKEMTRNRALIQKIRDFRETLVQKIA
jgi:hypothetical protein